MKVFPEIFKLHLKTSFQYRASFLISLLFDPILLFLYVSLITSIYENNGTEIILGYSEDQMIWYMGAVRFFYCLIWSSPDRDMSLSILSGDMALLFTKPISVFQWEFSKAIAGKVLSFLFEFIPGLVIFSLIAYPDFFTITALVKFLIICAFAFVLYFNMGFIIGTAAFRLQSNEALQALKMIILYIFAGALIPVEFFPESLQIIIKYLPFQYLYYVPIQFFLNMKGTEGWIPFLQVIGILIFWIICFSAFSMFYWRRMVKRFIAVGG